MPNSDRWKEIAFSDFNCDAFRIWKEEHLVLAAGDFAANEYNAMAVGGGFLGFPETGQEKGEVATREHVVAAGDC